jgi:hypothetical protein
MIDEIISSFSYLNLKYNFIYSLFLCFNFRNFDFRDFLRLKNKNMYYIETQRGAPVLVHEGYQYTKEKEVNGKIYWR